VSPIISAKSGLSSQAYGQFAASTAVAPDLGAMFPLGMVQVGSAGSSNITFSSIPATYKHLQLRLIARGGSGSSGSSYMQLTFNSIGSSVYSAHQLFGDGSSAQANAFPTQSVIYINRIAGGSTNSSTFGTVIMDILDYTSTSKYKTIRALGGYDDNGTGRISLTSGLYQQTTAISSLTLTPEAGNFPQYSQFALYGIKGA
jgi:hypothetical protein